MRRVIFYLFYDPRGMVDDYVVHKLRALREHAEHIFVVSNSSLTDMGRERLESVADTVWERRNVGFDVWAYKEAMNRFGRDRLLDYDELILMNYTFFAPIFPFSELFERMDSTPCEFWGVTAHEEYGSPADALHFQYHIQSHWIAVRRPMFRSEDFRQYWDSMPMITSYDDSIGQHESRFTEYFASRGFRYAVAFPPENYPSAHPVFDNAALLLRDRCPIVKRRLFFHDPVYLERNAILAKRVLQLIEATDYPIQYIWSNLARSAEPRVLYTNTSSLAVISDDPVQGSPPELRVCVIAHIYYEDMVDELMAYVEHIPVPFDLVVTTPSAEKAAVIRQALERYDLPSLDIRVVQNRGRDMSALFVGCRDILLGDEYDLICRIHSKKSPQDDFNSADLFKHHLLDNLLGSEPYVQRLLDLFANDPSLGMVFPPVVNIGYPTLGHAWFSNREPASALADELGIDIPFDSATPLAPYGSMFWARPAAIRRMAAGAFEVEDYPREGEYSDGSLSHVQERILGYCALTDGFHIRCVMNQDWAGINYAFLEYRLQLLSARLPFFTDEQVNYLIETEMRNPILLAARRRLEAKHPYLLRIARPAARAVRQFRDRRPRRRPIQAPSGE